MKLFNIIIFSIALGLSYSCMENSRSVANKDASDEEALNKIKVLLMTPDSLHSEKDKELLRQLATLYYEGVSIKNDRFVLTLSRENVKGKGLSEIVFDEMTKEINDANNFLDTTSFPKQLILNSYLESKKSFLAKEKLQHQK